MVPADEDLFERPAPPAIREDLFHILPNYQETGNIGIATTVPELVAAIDGPITERDLLDLVANANNFYGLARFQEFVHRSELSRGDWPLGIGRTPEHILSVTLERELDTLVIVVRNEALFW